MASTKTPASRPVANLARAAQRTRTVIEGLQSRLMEAAGEHPPRTENSESEDELERQLEAYFSDYPKEGSPDAAHEPERILDDLRKRVVDRVAERILKDWEQNRPGASRRLREEVMERLVERVLRQFRGESGL